MWVSVCVCVCGASVGVVTRAVVSDDWGGAGDGCLGLPFLKQFGALDMDLRTLDTTITGPAANAMGVGREGGREAGGSSARQ